MYKIKNNFLFAISMKLHYIYVKDVIFRNISEEIMITDGTHTYQTKGSCARTITYTAKEGKIYDIQFNGGCNGNLKMLSKLLEGMDAEEIVKKCGGNLCGAKSTSCADQLAKALSE